MAIFTESRAKLPGGKKKERNEEERYKDTVAHDTCGTDKTNGMAQGKEGDGCRLVAGLSASHSRPRDKSAEAPGGRVTLGRVETLLSTQNIYQTKCTPIS